MTQIPISKKTKAEILTDYQQLLEKYEELQMASKILSEPSSQKLLEKAKGFTAENFAKSLSDLRVNLNNTLNQLADRMQAGLQELNEIQQVVELSKKNLEIQYGIQVAADTLQNLITENENKKKEFEKELAAKQLAIAEEIAAQKRDWLRELEEYEYNTKIKQARETEAFNFLKEKQEADLKMQATEIENLRKQVANFPKELEAALKRTEQETAKKVNFENNLKLDAFKKDWAAEKNLDEVKIKNLEDLIKRQSAEITNLRAEAEKATKKAQELAVKIIESQVKTPLKPEEEKPLPKTPELTSM